MQSHTPEKITGQQPVSQNNSGEQASTLAAAAVMIRPQRREPTQLVLKKVEHKIIAHTYIEFTLAEGLNSHCNVLPEFEKNVLDNAGWFKRTFPTFYTPVGKMRITYPLPDSKFQKTIEGYLDTFAVRHQDEEIRESIEFVFELIKYTLYFIENDIQDPVEKKKQYEIMNRFCIKIRSQSYIDIPSLTKKDVQKRLDLVQSDLQEQIEYLARLNDGQKIKSSIENVLKDATDILAKFQEIVLGYFFDGDIPRDFTMAHHTAILADPSLTLSQFKNDHSIDPAARRIINTEEKFRFIRELFSTHLSDLRKQLRSAVLGTIHVPVDLLEGAMPQDAINLPLRQNEIASNQEIQQLFSSETIVNLQSAYQESFTLTEAHAVQFINSPTLSITMKEMSDLLASPDISESNKKIINQFKENLYSALILIVKLKSSLEIITNAADLVRDTGNLTPMLCFDLLQKATSNAESIFLSVKSVLIELQKNSSKVLWMSKKLGECHSVNKNFTHSYQYTSFVLPLIDRAFLQLSSFRAAMTTEALIKNLNKMTDSIYSLYAHLSLEGFTVHMSKFADLPRYLANNLQQSQGSLESSKRRSTPLRLGSSTIKIEEVTEPSARTTQSAIPKAVKNASLTLGLSDFLNLQLIGSPHGKNQPQLSFTQLLNARIAAPRGSDQHKIYQATLGNKQVIYIDAALKSIVTHIRKCFNPDQVINEEVINETIPKDVFPFRGDDVFELKFQDSHITLMAILNAQFVLHAVNKEQDIYYKAMILTPESDQPQPVLIDKGLKELVDAIKSTLMFSPAPLPRPAEVTDIEEPHADIQTTEDKHLDEEMQHKLALDEQILQQLMALDSKDNTYDVLLTSRFKSDDVTSFNRARSLMQAARRSYFLTPNEDTKSIFENHKLTYQQKINSLAHALNREQDRSYHLLSFKWWWPLVWITGVGAVAHLIAAAGAKLYRVFNQENIQKDLILMEKLNQYATEMMTAMPILPQQPSQSLAEPKEEGAGVLCFSTQNKKDPKPSENGTFGKKQVRFAFTESQLEVQEKKGSTPLTPKKQS